MGTKTGQTISNPDGTTSIVAINQFGQVVLLQQDITNATAQLKAAQTQIQFKEAVGDEVDTFPGTAGASAQVTVTLRVTDNVANPILVSDVTEVQVDITGGTASNKKLKQGANEGAVDGSLAIAISGGVATFIVEADADAGETVLLGLTATAGSKGLTVTDTATVSYS